jgi:hypothetical protein
MPRAAMKGIAHTQPVPLYLIAIELKNQGPAPCPFSSGAIRAETLSCKITIHWDVVRILLALQT